MATATKKKVEPPKPAKARKVGSRWVAMLIGLIGVAAIPVGLHAAGILALAGPGALAMVYPYVVLVKASVLHIPAEIAEPVAQALLYAQFPLYGLFMARVYRSRGFWIAINAVVWVHVLAWIVASVLAHADNPYLRF